MNYIVKCVLQRRVCERLTSFVTFDFIAKNTQEIIENVNALLQAVNQLNENWKPEQHWIISRMEIHKDETNSV